MTKDIESKGLARRDVLKAAGLGALSVAGAGLMASPASATPDGAAKLIGKLTGGAEAKEGKIKLTLPTIAENGATVPITISVDSPQTMDSYVKDIHVAAEGNPNPDVFSFHLTPMCGKAEVSSRMRLGGTQNIVVAAVMSDGTVYKGSQQIKVTIGGCGG